MLASFVFFLKRHEKVRWLFIGVGIALAACAVWLWFQTTFEAGPHLFNVPAATAAIPLFAAAYLLYLCALGGPGYEVFIGERPETPEVKAAEERVERTPTLQAMLDLDSKRLTGYYTLNQSQARWSFFWAVVAFVVGFATILAGIWRFYLHTETRDVDMAWLTSIAGVVTNAVSGMFLYLYNQIHARSLYYHNQLARVQLIGLAIHLAETHTEAAEKAKARNRIITDVLGAGHTLAHGMRSPTNSRQRGKSSEGGKSKANRG